VLGGHGADDHVGAVGRHTLEVLQAGEIDQVAGGGEPQLHHRNEAVAAGERPGVLAEIGEQAHGFGDG
jgi:hypothetical protein